MRASLFALPLLAGSCIALQAAPAQALNTVCTAAWSGSNVTPGQATPATPIVGTGYNCPATTVNTTVTVGTHANAGVINTNYIWGSGTGSSNYPTTSNTSIDIAVPANTNENLTVTFSQTVYNPYLYFGFTDPNTSFTFTGAFSLLQANNASKVGNTVQIAGGAANSGNDGFVVQMAGAYGPGNNLTFAYNNATGSDQSVTFTTGVYNVPGPLPLLGAAAAFGASRRLRQRIRTGA